MSDATERPDDVEGVPSPPPEPGQDGADSGREAPQPDRAGRASRAHQAAQEDDATPADQPSQEGQESQPRSVPDPNAWEQACAEDLAAERARRRAHYGPQPTSAAEELRKLAEAVANKLSSLQGPIAGIAAQTVVRQVIGQAKAVVEPVIERNPDVFDHLATAGSELLAAYRAAVIGQEQQWTKGDDQAARGSAKGAAAEHDSGDDRDDTPPGSERIDLD